MRERHDIACREGKLLIVDPEPAVALDQDVDRMVGVAPAARVARRCLPSVCQAPDGMKQNCSEPVSRMPRSTSDSASFSPGFAVKFLGSLAKDGVPPPA
jgi:hypothetical protein